MMGHRPTATNWGPGYYEGCPMTTQQASKQPFPGTAACIPIPYLTQIQFLASTIPFPATVLALCRAATSPISLMSLASALPITFLHILSCSATSPLPPPSQPSLYHQKITLAPSLSASGCLSAVSLGRSLKPGLENSLSSYLM